MNNELTNTQKMQIKFISGFLGSFASLAVCSPIDLIKVRVQTSFALKNKNSYNNIKQAFINTFSCEGIKGFYNGLKTGIATSPIFYSVYFPIYERSKTFYSNLIYKNNNTSNITVLTFASSTAAIISNLITTPMWVIRVRFQTEYMYNNQSTQNESFNIIKEIVKIYNKEGFRALYRGFLIELIGTPHIIIQFNLYEFFTKVFKKYTNTENISYKYVLLSSVISKSKSYFFI